MPTFLNRYATPFLTGPFLVSLVSGLALFFHVGPAGFHGMHEWLSLLLILPFALHLRKNWRPMTAYLRHVPMGVAFAASVALTAVFLRPGDRAAGGNPAFALLGRIVRSSPAPLAPLLDALPDAVAAALNGAGIAVADADQPVAPAAAAAAGKTTMDIAAALVPLLR